VDTLPYRPGETFGDDPLTRAEHRLTRAFTGEKLHENKDYLIYRGPDGDQPGKILIINPLTGEPLYDPATNLEQRWQDGLAQALEAKHGLDIHADPESDNTTPLRDVLNSYSIKVGASGTAKPAETALRSLGFREVAEVPRHDMNRLTTQPDSLHESEAAAQQAAVKDILENWNDGTGRPQQVIVHRNDWVSEIARQLIGAGIPRESIEALDAKWIMDQGTNRDAATEAAFAQAGQLGKITITGGFGGRGTNIKPVDAAYVLDAHGNRVAGGLRGTGLRRRDGPRTRRPSDVQRRRGS
jgi:preprotein translocase subunit SecA